MGTYRALCSKTWRIQISLLVATFGQGVLYAPILEAHVSRRFELLAPLIGGLPWLVHYTITFFRLPPPITPRTFRRLVLLMISWYVTNMVLLVALGVAGLIPTNRVGLALTAPWICAFVGGLSIPTLFHWCKLKGEAAVKPPDAAVRRAEVHWYEAHGIGRRRFKIKRFID